MQQYDTWGGLLSESQGDDKGTGSKTASFPDQELAFSLMGQTLRSESLVLNVQQNKPHVTS